MNLVAIGLIFTVISLILSNVKLKQRVKELEEALEKEKQEKNPDQSQ